MESQPQNPEFRNNPENFHLCIIYVKYCSPKHMLIHKGGALPEPFCHVLMIFANSLDPDQARQFVRPDLESSCLTL